MCISQNLQLVYRKGLIHDRKYEHTYVSKQLTVLLPA